MRYQSTRGGQRGLSFEAAVLAGLADDGGLFVPERVPVVPAAVLAEWADLPFAELAAAVLRCYIDPAELTDAALASLTDESFRTFTDPAVTPVVAVSDQLYVLELFHGPTLAFKDVALQFLGNLFQCFLDRRPSLRPLTVLGATSGDTGSAAIHGLRGRPGIEIVVLHPRGRVSPVQERQMTSVLDANVHNVAVDGTFDDCQNLVKELFGDADFKRRYGLSAINSINWARILVQTVYYFAAYGQLRRRVGPGVQMRVSVPTGNFGDALAGFYARAMGLPIQTLLIATNRNDILPQFFATGRYQRQAAVHQTPSPAMDIQISSNFERYLFYLADGDADRLAGWMQSFKETGALAVSDEQLRRARAAFEAVAVGDDETLDAIRRYYTGQGPGQSAGARYELCPHTAVGVVGAERLLLAGTGPRDAHTVTVCLATAHPAKFQEAFLAATGAAPTTPPSIQALAALPTRCTTLPQTTAAALRALVTAAVGGRPALP